MFCLRKGMKDADKRRDLGGGRWGEAVSRSLLEKLCRGDLSKMLNQKSESMDFRHRPGKEGKEMGRGEGTLRVGCVSRLTSLSPDLRVCLPLSVDPSPL